MSTATPIASNPQSVQLTAPVAALDDAVFQPKSDLWVALRNAPSDESHDEALLLCESSVGEWVAWVPGFGEITLNRSQFCQSSQEI